MCAEPLQYTAYAECGHKDACSKCVLRLRTVLKDQRCVYCQVGAAAAYQYVDEGGSQGPATQAWADAMLRCAHHHACWGARLSDGVASAAVCRRARLPRILCFPRRPHAEAPPACRSAAAARADNHTTGLLLAPQATLCRRLGTPLCTKQTVLSPARLAVVPRAGARRVGVRHPLHGGLHRERGP